DNVGHVRDLCLPRDAKLSSEFIKGLLGGVVVVRGEALRVVPAGDGGRTTKPVRFTAVPYATWDNPAPRPVVVWLPETPELAELPGEEGDVTAAGGVRVRASHVNRTDTLADLNDDGVPRSSNDPSLRRMTWWDHKGGTEWVSYRFPKPRAVSSAAV